MRIRIPAACWEALRPLANSRQLSAVVLDGAAQLDDHWLAFYLLRIAQQGTPNGIDIRVPVDHPVHAAAQALGVSVPRLLQAGALRTAYYEIQEADELMAPD